MSTVGERRGYDQSHGAGSRHLGAVRGLAGPENEGKRLAGCRLVNIKRREAATVAGGVE
jgi:hypothetical protein